MKQVAPTFIQGDFGQLILLNHSCIGDRKGQTHEGKKRRFNSDKQPLVGHHTRQDGLDLPFRHPMRRIDPVIYCAVSYDDASVHLYCGVEYVLVHNVRHDIGPELATHYILSSCVE